MQAAVAGHVQIVEHLLDYGANIPKSVLTSAALLVSHQIKYVLQFNSRDDLSQRCAESVVQSVANSVFFISKNSNRIK